MTWRTVTCFALLRKMHLETHMFKCHIKGIGGPGAPHLFELSRMSDLRLLGWCRHLPWVHVFSLAHVQHWQTQTKKWTYSCHREISCLIYTDTCVTVRIDPWPAQLQILASIQPQIWARAFWCGAQDSHANIFEHTALDGFQFVVVWWQNPFEFRLFSSVSGQSASAAMKSSSQWTSYTYLLL